jgi:hypothetical protein
LNEENGENDVDTTSISILDDAAVPAMHSNPHWKSRLKRSVKASNAFKSSAGQQKRVKRLSKVMKAKQRDSSAVEQNITAVNAAEGEAEIKEDDSNENE